VTSSTSRRLAVFRDLLTLGTAIPAMYMLIGYTQSVSTLVLLPIVVVIGAYLLGRFGPREW